MSVELSATLFQPCLNQTFQMAAGEQSFEAELIDVRGITSDTGRKDKSPFSLLFRAGKGMVVEQQTMMVSHGELGEHAIFMVPIGPDPDHEDRGMLYEAVFT